MAIQTTKEFPSIRHSTDETFKTTRSVLSVVDETKHSISEAVWESHEVGRALPADRPSRDFITSIRV
jgi:hypothetical protein